MKLIFKIYLIFLFFIGISAYSSEVRFIQITDIGLNKNNAYKLQETIKEINSYKDIDFVIFGGNNLQKASIENLNYFTHLLRKVNKKTYVLLGNTDVLSSSGINKEYYMKRIRRALWWRHSDKPNYTFKSKDYLFVVMDGSKQYFQSSNGYYSKSELMWLENVLKKNKKKDIIILQHFPLLETKSKWIETAKTEEYKEILDKYKNVKVIVSGHYGEDIELLQDGIYHIVTQKYSDSAAYKIIEIDLKNDYIGTFLVNE